MAKKLELANKIVELVGEKENIVNVRHCMTRLRFDLKDHGKVKKDELNKTKGVLGFQEVSGELQIIIGPKVTELYADVIEVTGIAASEAIEENLDEKLTENKKFSFKKIGESIINYFSPTVFGIFPVITAAGMLKTIAVLIGPDVANLVSADSQIIWLLTMLYDVSFYYLPVYLGYSAAKTLKINPLYGMYIGLMLSIPNFVGLVGTQETVSIFGIPTAVADYSRSFLPVMLAVWLVSYIVKFLEKYIPHSVSLVFVPVLTCLCAAPITLSLCAPIGQVVGSYVGNLFITIGTANEILRIVTSVLLSIAMPYMIMFGMHYVVLQFAFMTFLETGSEFLIWPACQVFSWVIYGIALGAYLKIKDKDEKASALSCFLSGFLGGLSEPTIFGVVLKYKGGLKALLICCAIGGLYVGLFPIGIYTLANTTNIFSAIVPFVVGGTANLIKAVILLIGAFGLGVLSANVLIKYDTDK